MEQLVQKLKIVQASTFSFYLKAHNYHWNVTGPNFAQYHGYLGDLYEEVFASVDDWSENIRKLNAIAPGSLSRFSELTVITDEVNVPDGISMMGRLYNDNARLLSEMYAVVKMAEDMNQCGLVNFIEGRIDVHEKHAWMLRSFIS